MNSAYLEELRAAHFGEMVGDLLFRRLCDRYPEHSSKLHELARLEASVGDLLEGVLARHRVEPEPTERVEALTHQLFDDLGDADWDAFLARLRDVVVPFVERFDRLHDAGPAEDRNTLRILRDHERALLRFLDAEIRREDELQPLERVLAELAEVRFAGGRIRCDSA
ncbi:hypothetical protein NXT3_PA00105 (plasmid) [Sinorhizobium fredii]|uniref:Uncharacterized protein n=1 Tax=Rhizobium fredii TaxID=380 RepID=A0A2L0HA71_RHIFR|nr:hypothetical protein NXT3_PA00105 [Sinorhizobium fredii]